jgi:hypothetical protein
MQWRKPQSRAVLQTSGFQAGRHPWEHRRLTVPNTRLHLCGVPARRIPFILCERKAGGVWAGWGGLKLCGQNDSKGSSTKRKIPEGGHLQGF